MPASLILILLSAAALSAPPTALAADIASRGMFDGGFRLLAGLLLVVGVLLLLYALSRRGLGWLPKPRSGAIRIREMRPLGPKKSLCLVEVRGQELLLGIGAERVELLCRLGEAPAEDFETALQAGLKERES